MKRIISALTALCLMLCFTVSAAAAGDPSLGLEWGMDINEAAAVLGITDIESSTQIVDGHMTFMFVDADLLGHSTAVNACTFIDSGLVMFGYEGIDGNFKDVYMELYDIYGPSPSYDTADFLHMMEYLLGADPDNIDIVNYNCWYFEDGTCMSLITMGDNLNLYYFDLNAISAVSSGAGYNAESLFPWGATFDEVCAIYNFTEDDVTIYQFSSVISVCILPISDYEEETYIFANGGLAAIFYDYYGSDGETSFADSKERISRDLCPLEDGGAQRTFAAMGLITPGVFASADEIMNCASGEMTDGTFVSQFFYDEGRYMFMVMDEDRLISAYD